MTAVLDRDARATLMAAARGERRPTASVPCGIRVIDPTSAPHDAAKSAPAPASTAQAAPMTIEHLLAAGEASPRQRTRTLAARFRQILAELRQELEADAATRKAEARVAQLRAQLAQAETALREARRGPAASLTVGSVPGRDDARYDARAVREWAQQAGVECNTHGRVPAHVVEAWRAATESSGVTR